jgi:formylglycine-generating enzyme required for sulfatase activity
MASGSVEVVRGGCRSRDAQRGRMDLASMAGSVARDPGFGRTRQRTPVVREQHGMTMLRIPEGSLIRIDLDQPDAKPQEVTLTRPFYLSDREVSVGLFQQFMGDAGYEHEKPKEWEGANSSRVPTDIGCRPRTSGNTRAERGVKRIIRLVTTHRYWASTLFSTRIIRRKSEADYRTPGACSICVGTCASGARRSLRKQTRNG